MPELAGAQDDLFLGVDFRHRLAPARGRNLQRKPARSNRLQQRFDQSEHVARRPVSVNFDQIEMRQAVDHAGLGQPLHAPEIIGVDLIDGAALELGFLSAGIEHLGRVEVMHRTQHEIQAMPVPLHPGAAGGAADGIDVEFDPRADAEIGVGLAQPIDRLKVHAGVIPIMIGERKIRDSPGARHIGPGLQQRGGVRLVPVSLRVRMIIGNWPHGSIRRETRRRLSPGERHCGTNCNSPCMVDSEPTTKASS